MRLRWRFSKVGKVRFLSHRDLARIWERTIRRLDLPIAYSSGFAHRQRLHFGLALSTGYESLGEYIDIDLDPERLEPGALSTAEELEALRQRCSEVLPVGIDCLAVTPIATSGLSLQEAVTSCSWAICLDGGTVEQAAAGVQAVLAASTLPVTRERKGKPVSDDIRPYVRSLAVATDPLPLELAASGTVTLVAELGTQPRTLRPSELVAALGEQWAERRVCRLHQWIEHDGTRREPLALEVAESSWARSIARVS